MQPYLFGARHGTMQGAGLGIHAVTSPGDAIPADQKEYQPDSGRPAAGTRRTFSRSRNGKGSQAIGSGAGPSDEADRKGGSERNSGLAQPRRTRPDDGNNPVHHQPSVVEMGRAGSRHSPQRGGPHQRFEAIGVGERRGGVAARSALSKAFSEILWSFTLYR